MIGGISGGLGAIINKKDGQKWYRSFAKGFLIGCGGGGVMYLGKKTNALIAQNNELGYAWVSRAVFSAGNSIVENASSNVPFWSQWHYDIGFIRLEFQPQKFKFTPKLMPSYLGTTIFLAVNGDLDRNLSLRSGTLTFKTPEIKYAPFFEASTPGNGILYATRLTGDKFYRTYAHEMVHVFQFQELSGCNYFVYRFSEKQATRSKVFKNFNRWIYPDFNYELMVTNYFLIQGGYKNSYSANFLENEAEILSVGKPATP